LYNWLVGSSGMPTGEAFSFTFDCPSPEQYWEIHIETPAHSPLPDSLDSMIGVLRRQSEGLSKPHR
jgi:hypothetical protein